MSEGTEKLQAKVVVSPRFRLLGGAHDLKRFEEIIPGMITTSLAQNRHIILIARKDAQDLLTQTVERIAKRDYFEAHEGGAITLTQHIHFDISKEELSELNQVLENDVGSRLLELGVDLLVYGKVLETKEQGIRLDVYLLDVNTSSLSGAEGIETGIDKLSVDLNAVSSRLAWAVKTYLEQRHGRKGRRTFAVLPFRNISDDNKLDNWQEGLTEEFITVLKNAKALQLVERAATARYKNQDNLDLVALGRELNVDVVLWGSYGVYEDDDQARKIVIRARLIETDSGNVIETFKEEGKIGYAVQAKIAQKVMQALYVKPTSMREVETAPTDNVDALEYVRIGIHHFDNQEYARAIESLQLAIKLDPVFPDAHYHLGMTYKTLKSYDKALEHFKTALGNAYDQSYGELLWKFRTGWTIWAKPITDNAAIYIGVKNNFYAVSKHTGSLKWIQRINGKIESAAFIAKNNLCVAADQQVYALNLEDGRIVWAFKVDGEVEADLVGNERALFVAANWDDDHHSPSGRIYALDLASGEPLWEFELTQPIGAPRLIRKQVVFGDKGGHLFALDESTGQLNWKTKTQERVEYAPATAEDALYWLSEKHMYAVDMTSGEILWDMSFQDSNACAPVVNQQMVYVAFGQKIYAIAANRSQGTVRWSYQAPSSIGSISVWDGIVYVTTRIFSFAGSGEHLLLAIDQDTGQLYWRANFGDSLYGATHIHDGVLYTGCRNHKLYAFNVRRSSVGLVRSTQIWNQIGLVQLLKNDAEAAVDSFRRCLAIDPTIREANQNLYEIYKRQKRVAKAIEVYQDYLDLLSEDERLLLRTELNELSGLQWTFALQRLAPLWLYPTIDPVTDFSPIVPSPAVDQGVLYIGSEDGGFHAVDASNGQRLWNWWPNSPAGGEDKEEAVAGNSETTSAPGAEETMSGTPKSIRSRATIWEGQVFFGASHSSIYALRADNGNQKWSFPTGGRVDSTPAVADGVLYVGSDDGAVYALTAAEGKLLWRTTTGARIKSSPAVADGALYVGAYDGNIYSLDVKTGQILWKFQTDEIINSSPVVSKGVVFLGPDDGYVYALEAGSGELKWKYLVREKDQSILRYGLGDESGLKSLGFLPSTPFISQGTLYVGSNGTSQCYLHAIDEGSGKLKWKYEVGKGEVSSPTVHDGIVYVGAGGILFHDQSIYGLSAKDGSLVWKYKTGGDILSAPAVKYGRLYCWAIDGLVYAFDISRVGGYTPERDATFYLYAGKTHFENSEIEAALSDFETASELDPGNADAYAGLADCYNRLGKVDLEQQRLEQFQALNPSSFFSYWRLGTLYMIANKIDQAIDQFQRYIKIQTTEHRQVVGHLLLGQAYQAKSLLTDAIREYDRAIEIGGRFINPSYGTDSDKDIALTGMLEAYWYKANLLFSEGQDIESNLDMRFLYQARLNDRHVTAIAYATCGLVQFQQGAYDQAAFYYEIALELDPQRIDLWGYLGGIQHEHLSEYEKAYQSFCRVWDIVKPDSNAAINLAEAAISVGRYDEALQLASQAAAESTNPGVILNGKLFACLASFLCGEPEKAEAELRALIEYREGLSPDFKHDFSYNGTGRYITNQTDLTEQLKARLVKIIDYVQYKAQSGDLT